MSHTTNELDEILKPIFDNYKSAEMGLIDELSTDIKRDEDMAIYRISNELVKAKAAIEQLIREARVEELKKVENKLIKGEYWESAGIVRLRVLALTTTGDNDI